MSALAGGSTSWRTYVVDTEVIQGSCDLNLLGGIEEGVGKLLALSQSTLNDLEVRDIAQEVANWLVRVRPVNVRILLGFEAGVARVSCN